jgi:hypothetical protein
LSIQEIGADAAIGAGISLAEKRTPSSELIIAINDKGSQASLLRLTYAT